MAIAAAASAADSMDSSRHTGVRSEEHTSELQSPCNLVCRLLLEKKKQTCRNLVAGDQPPASAISGHPARNGSRTAPARCSAPPIGAAATLARPRTPAERTAADVQ